MKQYIDITIDIVDKIREIRTHLGFLSESWRKEWESVI